MKVKCLTEFVTQMIKVNIIITFYHATMSKFCLSFLLIPNSFLQNYLWRPLRSRVGRQFQSTTQFLHGIVRSWHGDPWANAGFCPWQKRDFHQHSDAYLHDVRCFLCFTVELNHFSVRFRPLWNTCSHSPRDYAQVTNNWLTFVDYLLIIFLR
jgi:hypothetical protein